MLNYLNELHQRLSLPVRYALTFAAFLLALFIRLLILPIDGGFSTVTFYPMMVVCFFLFGFGPGLLMTLMSAVTVHYIFIPPYREFGFTKNGNISLVAFLISAALIGYVILQMQAYARKAKSLADSSKKAEAFYKGVLEEQTEYIFRFLPDGSITYINESFCRFFGKHREDFIGKQWMSIVFPEDLPSVKSELSKLSSDNLIVDIENRVFASNGDLHWCRFIARGFFDVNKNLVEIQSVGRDITTRKNQEDRMRELAFHDGLTQLPNGRMLQDRLNQTLSNKKRSNHFGALMFIDLDNFKPLNDMHGHQAGDLLLIAVGRRLKGCVREGDTVARNGGDEFVVLINKLEGDEKASIAQAGIIAEKVRLTLASPYQISIEQGQKTIEHDCTASIGVAVFSGKARNTEIILSLADLAMYKAKDAGRNQVKFSATVI